ncbi:CRIB domain-containing protein RIC7-like isoform X2 [Cynara cardunculus var. scolymus]|uniref:CRIB domain-containing protein RIC7-like isoform X2 n=1 Tax=Cynara cardunculus var. scolymus TaxID=59895 RepID=UPI000D629F22|nr:CRIB domain-containing protein RIC7-like isoform X2 [Cynara cardunculus var. scolymus]
MEKSNHRCTRYNPRIKSITFSMMGTHKVKGLLKGLRYISQVFDDDSKNQEIQIGAPTDVKHLAHVGCDGPVQDSPSWMREFGSPAQCQSASRDEAPSDGPDWASEDSSHRISRREKLKHRHRRHRSVENALDPDSRNKDSPDRSRQPRRRHTKTSYSERRHSDDLGEGDESPTRKLPEIPRRTRKKKPKEESDGGLSTSSRSKADEIGSFDAD